MSDKRAPRRSLDDWMELVTECRQSGLTDAAWCEAQGIWKDLSISNIVLNNISILFIGIYIIITVQLMTLIR